MTCLVNRSGSVPFRVTAEAFVSCDYLGGCSAALRFDLPPDELPVDFGRVNTDVSKLGWTVQIRWEDGEPYRRDRCPEHIHNTVTSFPSKLERDAAAAIANLPAAPKADLLAEAATVHVHNLAGLTDADVGPGIAEITAERRRQITERGHTRTSDLGYTGRREQDLIKAAAFYLAHGGVRAISPSAFRDDLTGTYPWPGDTSQIISIDPIVNLTKAGALIAAEIDRQQATR